MTITNSGSMPFDLLTTVETGGCSSKIPPRQLEELLAGLPLPVDPGILVDIATHDDAGVYKISDTLKLNLGENYAGFTFRGAGSSPSNTSTSASVLMVMSRAALRRMSA